MDYTLHSFLERLGLAQNEMKIYQAALELGETTAAQLAHKAHVHRVAAYALIDNLIKKGLLTATDAKRSKLISPTHPRELKNLIATEQRKLKKLELQYEAVLPELTSLFQRASVLPRVQFFEGVKGLVQINHDIIETLAALPEKDRVTYSYANPDLVDKTFEGYVSEKGGYIDQRKTHNIWNKVIALESPLARDIQKRDAEELREMIMLPQNLFPFHSDITIYGNKMAIQALRKELIGVIIESREIVEDQYAIFRLAWEGALALSKQ
ncbi:MAG: hypothetical protein KIH62_002020 [Candidatus Kerfeldbacteria bacterium]|nr:hypothetical protein [Candidatus Kerfeldbacteria bacterium]